MSTYAHPEPPAAKLTSGFAGALILHAGLAAALIAYGFLHHSEHNIWGENASSVGTIQASIVSALPLPVKVPPVEKAVLATENPTKAPEPPPKEKTEAPPKKTDLLVKAPTPVPPKPAAKTTPEPPKHPQPTPDTPKAVTGDAAPQLPQSVVQVANGTATTTVKDRAFGNRYAYYRDIVARTVSQNWYKQEADPRASQGKSVTVLFDINRDGTVANLHVENRSGSPTLDTSTLRAVQRVESFGPLPGAADHVTVEYKFDY